MSRRVFLLFLFAQVLALASAALAIVSDDPEPVELIPPMICQRGAMPACWTVPE